MKVGLGHVRKLEMNPDISGAAMEEFLKQGRYMMNMQTFSKGGYGSSVRREMINRGQAWRQRPLRRRLLT